MSKAMTKSEETMRGMILGQGFQTRLTDVAAASLSPEKFTKMILLRVYENPKLAECTPDSFAASCLKSAAIGIPIDGEKAHLVPFRNSRNKTVEAQLVIDYKGYIDLGISSGAIVKWDAELVCDNDDFSYTNGEVTHSIDFRQKRGEPFAVYSRATLPSGEISYCVMTKEEVMAIKNRSPASKSGPWVTDEPEMWKKTAIRRHRKTLSLSPAFEKAMEADYDKPIDINSQVDILPEDGVDPMAPKKISDKKKEEAPPEPGKDIKKPASENLVEEARELEKHLPDEKILECWKRAGVDPAEDYAMMEPEKVKEVISLFKVELGK